MSHHKKPEHHIRPYKIAAQTAGLVACIFVLIFFAGNGIPEILKNEEKELIPFIPFLVLPVAGYIVAWYKEVAGTVLLAMGGTVLLVFFIVEGDAAMGLVYGQPS